MLEGATAAALSIQFGPEFALHASIHCGNAETAKSVKERVYVGVIEMARSLAGQAETRTLAAELVRKVKASADCLATLGGAAAIGLCDTIGSLTVGKRADICVARLDGLNVAPGGDDSPISSLVFGGRAADIQLTMVDGRTIYDRDAAESPTARNTLEAVREARKNLWQKADLILAATR